MSRSIKKVPFKRKRSAGHRVLLTSGMFKPRVVELKTGYKRHAKHRKQEME
jgi:hypothetical protein